MTTNPNDQVLLKEMGHFREFLGANRYPSNLIQAKVPSLEELKRNVDKKTLPLLSSLT